MIDNVKSIALAAALGLGGLAILKLINRRINAYDFSGKVVLITGGSRGLGLVIARKLASEGAKIAICSRNKEDLIKAKLELETITSEVIAIPTDLRDRTQVNKMIQSVRETNGLIDVLINNAGIIQVGPYDSMTIEDYEEAMSVHFWAPLYAMLAVIPHMRKRSQGRIVNISSIGGKVSIPHLLPYSASKFALTGLSEGLRSELKKDGITVTTVCPGLMRTGSTRNIDVKGQHEKEYTWFKISDSMPFLSMNVESSAKKIINACRYGDAEVVLSYPAKLATVIHGVFPGTSADFLAGINSIMPDNAEEGGMVKKKGYQSETAVTKSFLTALDDEAADKNNEKE